MRLVLLLLLHVPFGIPFVLQLQRHQCRRTLENGPLHANKSLEPKRKTRLRWDDMIVKLERFYETHGTSLVKKDDDEELFEWCKQIRYRYGGKRASNLPDYKRQRLEQVGFVWSLPNKRWEAMIVRLEEYYKQNGHTRVSKAEDVELHRWCLNVRRKYGSLERPLSPEQREQLEAMNFALRKPQRRRSWEQNFEEVREFLAEHGHCSIPGSQSRLTTWGNRQLINYKLHVRGQNSTITPTQLKALESIGFSDKWGHDGRWQKRYEELREFFETYNHSVVPYRYAANVELGRWVNRQRVLYKEYLAGKGNGMTPERIQALEELDFCWDTLEHNWFSMLDRLKRYQQRHGHLKISEEDSYLRNWLSKQRSEYKRMMRNETSRMTERRQSALEAIPGFERNLDSVRMESKKTHLDKRNKRPRQTMSHKDKKVDERKDE